MILYYLHGLSLQETAELLDVRLGTVKSRLHYALRSLRTRLEGDRRFGGAYGEASPVVADPGGGGPMMGRSTGCASQRAALLGYAERSERGPEMVAAFEHLDRCRRCQADLTGSLLTVHAVRRTLAEAVAVDPPADAWLRLREPRPGAGRERLGHALDRSPARSSAPGSWRALIGPTAILRPADGGWPGAGPAGRRAQGADTTADQRAEAAFLSRPRAERPAVRAGRAGGRPPTAAWSGPDGLGRVVPTVRIDVPPERVD